VKVSMINKKRSYNKKFWAVFIIFITVIYMNFFYINNESALTSSSSKPAEQRTISQSCLLDESCDEYLKHAVSTIAPAVTTQPVATIKPTPPTVSTKLPITIYPVSPPPPADSINTERASIKIKLQGKEILKESNFLSEDIHQCRIEFDKQSVLKINSIIEQFSYEIDLSKSTYKINHNLKLNVISPNLPEHFNEILVYKIQTLLQIYRQSFGLNLHKKSEINLVILPSQASYEDFITNLSLDSTNTQGLFWARSNYAFVAFKNIEQAGETAFHEAVHAINFSLVGLQSRWLNEGLAEVFENMKVTQENGNNIVNLKFPQLNNQPIPMGYQELVYAEQQWWDSNQVQHLYSSSLFFTSYLFAFKEGIDILTELLKEESNNPCSTLPMDQYFQLIDESIFYLPTTFDEWLYAAS